MKISDKQIAEIAQYVSDYVNKQIGECSESTFADIKIKGMRMAVVRIVSDAVTATLEQLSQIESSD